MLDIPDDAGPQAQELLWARVGRWHLNEMYNSYREKMENGQLSSVKSVRNHPSVEEEREQLTPDAKGRANDAVAAVEANWQSLSRTLRGSSTSPAAAYNKGKLGHVDKSFALRYGLDVTSKKRLDVRIIEKLHKNYVNVELMDFNISTLVWPSRSATIVTAWASG